MGVVLVAEALGVSPVKVGTWLDLENLFKVENTKTTRMFYLQNKRNTFFSFFNVFFSYKKSNYSLHLTIITLFIF